MRLSNNKRAFLALVRAGLWEQEVRLSQFETIDFSEVYRLAEEQAVVGLVTAGIEHVVDIRVPQEYTLMFVGCALQLSGRGTDFFTWIREAREITNYKQQIFKEPDTLDFFTSIKDRMKNGASIKNILDNYSSDWSLYCFQDESAIIAGPYFLIVEAYNLYHSQMERITVPEKRVIDKFISILKIGPVNTPFFDM